MNLQPPSVLVSGPAGSGKTTSIVTMLMSGLRVFDIVTEPDGLASLLDACRKANLNLDNLHWVECLPTTSGFMELEDMISKINSMDQKGLSDIKNLGKSAYRDSAMKFLGALKNFTCERTGKSFGPFTSFDDTSSLTIDSLTGWSDIAFGCTVGYKPTANPGEWGIAQNFVYNMLRKINNDRRCFFVLTTHIEKENDDMTGVRKVTVSTIGAKLAPKIPVCFSEVVRARRDIDGKFYWSNLEPDQDLKSRALPSGNKLEPNFLPIIQAYSERKRFAQSSVPVSPAVGVVPSTTLPNAPMRPQ